eukprot:Em0002g1720a
MPALRAPAFHPYGSQQYRSRAAPKLVYSGAPTAAGSSQGVLSAAGWHQILGSVCQCSYPQQMYGISHDARGKENLISSLVTVHITLLSSSIPQATPSSFNMLAELEAYRHKRDEAAQQNEAPVAGSVEGQSVPVKIETLVGKVVQLKLCNRTGGNSPGKSVKQYFGIMKVFKNHNLDGFFVEGQCCSLC